MTPKADTKDTIESSDQLQQTDQAVANTTLRKLTVAPKTLKNSVKWIER